MKALFVSVAFGIGALLGASAYAQAPAGAIAQCKDGTYFTGTTHKGACKGHQGVKEWLDKAAPTTTKTAAPAPAAANDAAKTTTSKTTKQATNTASAAAPAGAIALCKDGTYFTGTSHQGACKGHNGVKEWLDKDKAAATPAAAPAAAAAAAPAMTKTPTAAPAPAAAPPTSSATTPHTPPTPASQIAQKPGGGPGLVWVNASSKVYHCPGDEWYGKTKEGSYMTEAAAKAAGNHADHGKECGTK